MVTIAIPIWIWLLARVQTSFLWVETEKGILLYRVPEFLSSRLNWAPHPLLASECAPPPGPRGVDTFACGGGGTGWGTEFT
jgi:hypothetical protein